MKKKLLLLLSTVALFVVLIRAGSYFHPQNGPDSLPDAVWHCLEKPELMTLYFIHPGFPESTLPDGPRFHGYRILEQVPIHLAEEQLRVAQVIKDAVSHPKPHHRCFEPRHALHVGDGRNTCDFVICFYCGVMNFYLGDGPVDSARIDSDPEALDAILHASNILGEDHP